MFLFGYLKVKKKQHNSTEKVIQRRVLFELLRTSPYFHATYEMRQHRPEADVLHSTPVLSDCLGPSWSKAMTIKHLLLYVILTETSFHTYLHCSYDNPHLAIVLREHISAASMLHLFSFLKTSSVILTLT
jgi:hypothetical protein